MSSDKQLYYKIEPKPRNEDVKVLQPTSQEEFLATPRHERVRGTSEEEIWEMLRDKYPQQGDGYSRCWGVGQASTALILPAPQLSPDCTVEQLVGAMSAQFKSTASLFEVDGIYASFRSEASRKLDEMSEEELADMGVLRHGGASWATMYARRKKKDVNKLRKGRERSRQVSREIRSIRNWCYTLPTSVRDLFSTYFLSTTGIPVLGNDIRGFLFRALSRSRFRKWRKEFARGAWEMFYSQLKACRIVEFPAEKVAKLGNLDRYEMVLLVRRLKRIVQLCGRKREMDEFNSPVMEYLKRVCHHMEAHNGQGPSIRRRRRSAY